MIAPLRQAFHWLANQPYLLLSLTSLFWAGNIVLGRAVAGHIPPVTLSCVRWIGAMLLMLPVAWPHLRRDWRKLRGHWKLMVVLSATGFAINNVLSYWGLQYTQALNALLMQSSGPLFVALWSLLLFGVRLTWMQAIGIGLSLLGVLTIILRGDFAALAQVEFNRGDLMVAGALCAFGMYSALMPKRPATHPLSLIIVTTAGGALLLLPLAIWEFAAGVRPSADWVTITSLAYVVIFPSALAYLCFNRGVALIGPNRSAPFLHLMPVFGSVMAIVLLGEKPELFHLAGYAMVIAGVFIAARR
ncbi:multidrug DMT transporter permease [Rhodopseudomonas sp. AAP120]|uniref:DMT family transporter n=1 Tax=Rhodopseudomonas sp. AAP120 TaxID=1523430 RepID=UPI0006B8ACD3|nr:DMT family transporter [Rhodopseudomonas sp. AAP120]KPF90223.1 multidrug DMT transporter permease [Rhodopseudomonas sp. AAP120]